MLVTRFAPSPTGYLHLGHAWSAWQAWRRARSEGGRFLLRLEDIDTGRCRPEYETAIFEDLAWLGLEWEQPVLRQSEHFDRYRAALASIRDLGLAYPCFCTRADIRREIEAAGAAPHGPPQAIRPTARPGDRPATHRIRPAVSAIPAPAAALRRRNGRPGSSVAMPMPGGSTRRRRWPATAR